MTQLETSIGQVPGRPSSVSIKKSTTISSADEVPHKTFEKQKTVFRYNQVIYYLLGTVESLLLLRLLLKAFGANPFNAFTQFIYHISAPFEAPFNGIFTDAVSKNYVFEWSTLIAMGIYALLAYGITKLGEFIKPVTPEEVEEK